MKEYVSDCTVSQPMFLPDVKADVDMGGLKFSYEVGLFYVPAAGPLAIKMPPSFEGSP